MDCLPPVDMKKVLLRDVEKPLDHWRQLLLDQNDCNDCVQEYHSLAEELIESEPNRKKVKTCITLSITYIIQLLSGCNSYYDVGKKYFI